jgi:outer membrane lipoprotein-sorting protein
MAFRPINYINSIAAAALTLTAALAAQAAPDIRALTSANVKTLSASSEIVTENQGELKKIDGDISLAYRLHRGSMVYEQPGKLRIEASIPHLATGYYVINGNRKLTVAPFVHKVQDTTGAPGKRQTLLDFGLVPPELLTDYNVTFLRRESGLLCFQVQPKQAGETQKDLVWIDPKTHITAQRYNYGRDGKLTKWFLYKNPVQIAPGIYVPTRVELYNTQNKLAGATVYQNVKVNQPVSESLFKTE